MRSQHIVTIYAAIVATLFAAGCSKSASPPSQAASGLVLLQQQFLTESNQIKEAQANLKVLRQTYTSNEQPYIDAQKKLEQMIRMHQVLYSKLESEKIDLQLKAQGKN